MSGLLYHAPAEVLRRVAIALGLCVDPDDTPNGAWPASAYGELDSPDEAICFYDTLGREDGRLMTDGEKQYFHGFQVRVRARTPDISYAKANVIADALAKRVLDYSVMIAFPTSLGSHVYLVHDVSPGDITPLRSYEDTRRTAHVFNGLMTVNLAS